MVDLLPWWRYQYMRWVAEQPCWKWCRKRPLANLGSSARLIYKSVLCCVLGNKKVCGCWFNYINYIHSIYILYGMRYTYIYIYMKLPVARVAWRENQTTKEAAESFTAFRRWNHAPTDQGWACCCRWEAQSWSWNLAGSRNLIIITGLCPIHYPRGGVLQPSDSRLRRERPACCHCPWHRNSHRTLCLCGMCCLD